MKNMFQDNVSGMSGFKLSDSKPGIKSRVVDVSRFSMSLHQRFMDIGIMKGALIEFLRCAPLGRNTIAIWVRGVTFALRRTDAHLIASFGSRSNLGWSQLRMG